jgi:PAS domain S-box-containing protein
LAVLVLYGFRLWPGVFIGAFLVNLTTQGSIATALGIAGGNTFEALLGAWFTCRFANGSRVLERTRDILVFLGLAALLSTAASATIGVTTLCGGGFGRWDQYGAIWLTWWLGDVTSNLIVAPLLLAWLAKPWPHLELVKTVEAAGVLVATVLAGTALFLGGNHRQLEYLALPPVLWAAIRFGVAGATGSTFVMSALAVWGTWHRLGPFAQADVNQSLVLLQTFMGVIALTTLALALVVTQRARAERRLQVQGAVSRILTEAPTLRAATPKLFQVLAEHGGGWEVGALWTLDHDADALRCTEIWHAPGLVISAFEERTLQTRFARGEGLPGRVWSKGEPEWLEDVTGDDRFQRAAAAAESGLRAALCFPLKLGAGVAGVMECFSRCAGEPEEDLLQVLADIGGQLGQFLERKRAEQARAHLAAIVESSHDAIIGGSLDGFITSWNTGAERIFGYTAQEALGQPLSMLAPKNEADTEPEILRRLGQGHGLDHYETVRVRKDGRRMDISLTVSPIRDGAGNLIGASRISRDITERKRTERALAAVQAQLQRYAQELEQRVQKRTAKLQETVRSLDGFCYTIAHDLRAPLRAMTGFSAELVETYAAALNPQGRDYLIRIQASAARMDALIRDLLEFGRLNTVELDNLGTVELPSALRKALLPLESEIAAKGGRVELREPLMAVRGSKVVVEQVFANLLANALKFVSPDIPPQVQIWTEPRLGMVRVCVQDNGIGIKREHIEKLFQPFVRLVNANEFPGTGIGLAIVRKGVERMGGHAGVESQLGKGSCFWIELPRAVANGG